MTALFWFRRDYRLADNIALNLAVEYSKSQGSNPVYATALFADEDFSQDNALRKNSLIASLEALDKSLGGNLNVLRGADFPACLELLLDNARAAGITRVYATRAFDPDGVRLQKTAGIALAEIGVDLHLHDSYYAVLPGSVKKPDGTSYRVYTPFYRVWSQLGWQKPVTLLTGSEWALLPRVSSIPEQDNRAKTVSRAGELYALRTWERFKHRALEGYSEDRNRADLAGTSHLSHALAFGEIHPRTLLAQLGDRPGHEVFRKELAWREFYADVLWQEPRSYSEYLDPKYADMQYDTGEEASRKLTAWKQGKTGYPMVDAGMRQLLETGWMHNRVRMIVASFLVKDLHLEWQHGADWFEAKLTDFDPASNSHGWQWTAGCGTDASPYYRVFNPVLQGLKFDPNGDYVRKYIPELRHIDGAAVHEPWNLIDGSTAGYPSPIVDHAAERDESLRRLEALKNRA